MGKIDFTLVVLPLLAFSSPALSYESWSEADTQAMQPDSAWPAARLHVKQIDGRFLKLTSRLAKIVELNFTFGNSHQPGKAIIAASLDRIASKYGGIAVQHFKQGTDGATGIQPNFTLDDLLSGQVIVANNVGQFSSASMGAAKQEAIRQAIETEGRGYLGFHGSGDAEQAGWPWFTNTLFPLKFQGTFARISAPVYKHLSEANHIVMEGILETNTTDAIVPDETDASGDEKLTTAPVAVRQMRNEFFRFGRQIADEPAFKDKVTILLKFDPRNLGAAFHPQYSRKGGNLYTFLYKVGAGMTSYIPAGHENDELLAASTGFDGGAGDFDRYVAQTLFFLAGYDTTACDASCDGLPVVDAGNRLVAPISGLFPDRNAAIAGSGIVFGARKPTFTSRFPGRYDARLLDIRGRVVERKQGTGDVSHAFDTRGLEPGVYVLRVKIGSRSAQNKRYIL